MSRCLHCCLVVTCWKRADLLAFVCDVYFDFITFPFGILGLVLYLIVSIIVSEHDQEIPQSQTADNPVAP